MSFMIRCRQEARGEIDWWARGDLNPGPPPCKGGVLTRLDDGPAPQRHSRYVVIDGMRGKG